MARAPAALWRYGGALALTVGVVAARLALNPVWGSVHNRHLVFLPTVMIVAYFAGFGPGLVATVISSAALERFWSDGSPPHPGVTFDLVLYLVACVTVCALVHSLHAARTRAEQAGRSRERVMAVVAHDLRNPLNTVKLSLHLLREGAAGDSFERRLRVMDGALGRMQSLISDLVDVTRIERGELAIHLVEVDAVEILREMAASYAPLALERHISIETEIHAPDEGLPIRADRERLMQALGNLVGNALRYTPTDGKITLTIGAAPGLVRIDVSDTGPGLAESDLPHLFEPFWKGRDGGTGLGLFIAAEIVRAHGGRLTARNEAGRGACFSVELPTGEAL